MAEQYANRAQGTLQTSLPNNSTTVNVVLDAGQGAAFPSSGNFRFYIDSEVFIAQGRSTDTLTSCLRAQEGSSAAAHVVGSVVTHVLTAGSYVQGISERITTHEGLADPHPGYATDTDLTTHAAAADPHTGYQKESEKAAASGYASLDGSTKVPIAQLPTGTSSSTVALGDAVATHAAAADPHPTYETAAEAQALVDTHVNDTSAAHAASAVSFSPTGTIAATDVQAAIAEAATESAHPNLATHDALGLATDAELATHAAASDPHTGYLKESELGRTYNIRSVTTGTSDDTAAIQGLHDAAADGDTILVQPGTYTVSQLNWTKKVNIVGVGTPENVIFAAKSGMTGPLLNVNFASLKHHLRLENFYVDMTNATGQVGLYLNNLDLGTISNVKVREGTVGFDIDSVAASDFNQCWAFNQRTSGCRVKNAAAIDNTYNRCVVYMTSGAAASMTGPGFDIQAGGSNYLNGVRVLRDTSSSFFMPYGIKCDSALTTDWLFLNNVVVDGITDGTGANSATSAGLYLLNCTGVFSVNSFYSANSSSGQKQRGVVIDGGSRLHFVGGRISGSGLRFANTVDNVSVQTVDFPANYSDAALNFGSATVTNLIADFPTPGAAVADDLTKLAAALTLRDIRGSVAFSADITPPQITSNQDNYAPTGGTTCSVMRLSTDASRNITGITGGSDGRLLKLLNVGAQNIVLKHDVTSTAANRLYCPGDSDYTLAADGSVDLLYDATSSRWRVLMGYRQAISAPPAIGTATTGSGTSWARNDHVHATGAGTPSTQAFGDAAATGTGPAASMTDHKHAMPADPVTAHVAASDPHTGYVQESLFTAAGQMLVGTGAGTLAVVDSRTAPNRFTVYGDTSGYYVRDEQSQSQAYTTADTTDISGIWNSMTAALGTGNLISDGGSIGLAKPIGLSGTYSTKAPLNVYTQQMIRAEGWSVTIKAVTGFPTTGTEAAPQPVINAYNADRVVLRDFAIDCNSIAGSTGVLMLRNVVGSAPDTGGQFSKSLVDNIEIRGYASVGLQVGKSADTGATSNLWVRDTHIYGGPDLSKCFATYIGDLHLLDGNNFRSSLGYIIWINASTVRMVGESHYGKVTGAASVNTYANIHVESGASVTISGAYLDNVWQAPAVDSKGFKTAIMGCHVNGDSHLVDNVTDVFRIENNDAYVQGNDAVGGDGTHQFRSFVDTVGTPTGSRVYGNRLTFGAAFWRGTAPAHHNGNTLINNTTWSFDQDPMATNAGAISDANYIAPQDGNYGLDTTNHRLYVRDGGTWRSVEIS